MVYMPKATVAGESITCPTCATDGITVIIHAVESEYQGQKKLSWKNPDGSGHVKKQDDGTWTHTQFDPSRPSQHQETITKLSKTISPENQAKVEKMYASLNESGEADSFAVLYMALRNKFMEYIDEPDVRTAGQICGNMLTNYLQTHNIPVDFVKASSMPAETSESKTLIHNFGLANSTSHKGSFAAQGIELATGNGLTSLPNPFSFSKKQIRFVPKCIIHGVMCDEETFECKKCVAEAEEKSKRIDSEFATSGAVTVDRGLLL